VANQQKPRVGIIGLGIMGGIMAETLLLQGYVVVGHDIAPACRARLRRAGGRVATSGAQVAQQCDVLIFSLASSHALASVVAELATAPHTGTPQIVIETSTLPVADKERAALALKQQRRSMLDCPISGTAARMKDRAWTIYVSGPKRACQQVTPILQAFTDMTPYIGPLGAGTKLKFAANHLVAIYNVAYAESVNLCRKMGLDPAMMLKHFGNSPVLGTGVMRLRMPFMIDRQYAPPTMKVEVWQKDMQVIGDMAKSVDCPTPLFHTTASIYTAAMAMGLAKEDTASTAEVLAHMSGVKAASPKRSPAAVKRASSARKPSTRKPSTRKPS
jgi:3-hydroxyisobutyrate dehydrogenase-like beta-hydroxyacid dehydrogenase